MSKSVNIGIIGCGSRAIWLARRLKQSSPALRFTAFMDPASRAIERAREDLNPDATVYDDYHDLVSDSAVDWVLVGSWNCFHAEQVVAAFRAGKHVFSEKPLALSIPECVAIKEAWKNSGRNFTIGFTLRWASHYRKIRKILDSGQLGHLISLEFNETLGFNHGGFIHTDWRRLRQYAGSHLLEKCCHDIDLVNWFVGSKAARVTGFGGLDFFVPENNHHIQRLGKDDQGRDAYLTWPRSTGVKTIEPDETPFTSKKDILDNQVAIIEFENGVRATFHGNANSAIHERRMVLIGSEGALRADLVTGEIALARVGFNEKIQDAGDTAKGMHGGGDQTLVTSLIASMVDGASSDTSVDDGIKSAVTAFGIDLATEKRQVVEMAPLWKEVGLG